MPLIVQDQGFGVINPSGSDQTVALVSGSRLLIQPRDSAPILYNYRLHEQAGVERVQDAKTVEQLLPRLQSFLQVATKSLLDNTTGVGDGQTAAGSLAKGQPSAH